MARVPYYIAYRQHSVRSGIYRYTPEGKLKSVKLPAKGAVAAYEAGSDMRERTTLTRVAAGAIARRQDA